LRASRVVSAKNRDLRASSVVFAIFNSQNVILAKTTLLALKTLFYLDFSWSRSNNSNAVKIWIK